MDELSAQAGFLSSKAEGERMAPLLDPSSSEGRREVSTKAAHLFVSAKLLRERKGKRKAASQGSGPRAGAKIPEEAEDMDYPRRVSVEARPLPPSPSPPLPHVSSNPHRAGGVLLVRDLLIRILSFAFLDPLATRRAGNGREHAVSAVCS